MEFFDQFDTAIKRACSTSSSALHEERRKTILLREVLTYKGYFNRKLFDFINWLVSSTERERHISKSCNIQFIRRSPSQEKTDPYSLLKVSIHAESDFGAAKKDKEWIKQTLSYWKKYCSETNGVSKQITANWTKPLEVDQSPSSFSKKRSLSPSPQKSPRPTQASPKTSISPARRSPVRSPVNSGSKTFLALHSSSGKDWEEAEKRRRSISPMKGSLPAKIVVKKKCDDQSSEISSLSCSITMADEFTNDATIHHDVNSFRNDNLTVVMMQPLTAYTLLLNQQYMEQSFTLQKMIMEDTAISKSVSADKNKNFTKKEPMLHRDSLHKSKDSFDGNTSKSSLTTDTIKLDDEIKSSDRTFVETQLLTSKEMTIVPPETIVTQAEKSTSTGRESEIVNESKSDTVQSAGDIVNSSSGQPEVVYSTPDKLQTNSILKQQINLNDSDFKKSKKSVDFTGVNFENGEELPLDEGSNSNGKLYRLRYTQKLLSVKSEKNHFTDEELSLYKAVLQENGEDEGKKLEKDIPPTSTDFIHTVKRVALAPMSKSTVDDKSFSYRKNPLILPKSFEKTSKSPSKTETAIIRSLSDETICEAMKNGLELPKPQRLRSANSLDSKLLRAPLSPQHSSSLQFPPRHIRAHSLDSKSKVFNGVNNSIEKFEKPKLFPKAISYYSQQDQNDDSTIDASLLSVGERETDRAPVPVHDQSSPELKNAYLGDPEFVHLKKSLDKVNEQYDTLRADFEKEKRKVSELWVKRSKEVNRSLILKKDASSIVIKKKTVDCGQEKNKLEKELEVCQEALQKLYIFIDMNMFAEKSAGKEKLRLRLESKQRAVKAYKGYLDKMRFVSLEDKDKARQSSVERFQTLDKTHQLLCGYMRFQVQVQSDLITSEILDQLKSSRSIEPKSPVAYAIASLNCSPESSSYPDEKSAECKMNDVESVQPLDTSICTSMAPMDHLESQLPKLLTGQMYKLDGQNQWVAVCLCLEQGVLSIFPAESSKLNLMCKITCDERMELYDAPDAELGTRNQIFYIQFADSFDSLSISSSTSTDKDLSSTNQGEKKNNVIYLSAISAEQKVEWIGAIAAAIKVNSKSKDLYTVSEMEAVDTTIFQPEIWPTPFQPMVNMYVQYGSDAIVQDGNAFTIDQFLNSPTINFDTKLTGFYSILMVDLDSSSYEANQCSDAMAIESILNNKERVYLHWALLNITGENISSGLEVLPYHVSKDNGSLDGHRLFFLLFQQTAEINDNVLLSDIMRELKAERENFSYVDWAKNMQFSDPVGLNGFYVDDSVRPLEEADEPFQNLNADTGEVLLQPSIQEEYSETAYFDDIYAEKEEPALIYNNKPDPIFSSDSYPPWMHNEKESLPSPVERSAPNYFDAVSPSSQQKKSADERKTSGCLSTCSESFEIEEPAPIEESNVEIPNALTEKCLEEDLLVEDTIQPTLGPQPHELEEKIFEISSNDDSSQKQTTSTTGQPTSRSMKKTISDCSIDASAMSVEQLAPTPVNVEQQQQQQQPSGQSNLDDTEKLTKSLEKMNVNTASNALSIKSNAPANALAPETPKGFSAKSSIAQRYIGSLNKKDSEVSDVSAKLSTRKSDNIASKCTKSLAEEGSSEAVFPSVVKKWQEAVKNSPKPVCVQQPATAKDDIRKEEESLQAQLKASKSAKSSAAVKHKDGEILQAQFKASEVRILNNHEQIIKVISEDVPQTETYEGELMPLASFPAQEFRESRDPDYFLDMEQSHVQRAKIELFEDLSLQAIFQNPIDLSPLPTLESISMNIYYPNMERVIGGGVISAFVAQEEPSVSYKSHVGENYYTIILSDPDALWLLMDEHVHWVVANIPGDQVKDGTVVLPYLGPAPAQGSGMHRFVFSLYRQTTLFDNDQIAGCVKHFQVRQGIRTHNFITSLRGEDGINMVDSTPVGLEAFLCEWENGLDELTQVVPPVETDDVSVEISSVMTSPSVCEQSPIVQDSSSKSSSKRSKRPKLSKQMRYYTDRILSMMTTERSASAPSEEHKSHDYEISSSVDRLVQSNTYDAKDNLKKRPLSFNSRNSSTTSMLDSLNCEVQSLGFQGMQSIQGEKEQLIEDLNVKEPPMSSSLSSRLKLANLTPPKIISDSPLSFENEDGRPDVTFIISPDNKDNMALPFDHTSSPKVVSKDDFEESKDAASPTDFPFRVQSTTSAAEGDIGSNKNRGPQSLLSRRNSRIGNNGAIQNPLMLPVRSLSPTSVPRNGNINNSSSAEINGNGNFPQIQLAPPPPRARSQSPVVANGGTQKKFSPFLIMSLASSPKELCNMLGIESTGMFDGEMVKKKFSTDFIFKENFVWMDSTSRSIHWAKSIGEKSDPASSRYIMLAKTQDSNMIFGENKMKQAAGEMRGTAVKVEETTTGIVIHTDMGECLEMKMSGKQCEDWIKVLRTLNC